MDETLKLIRDRVAKQQEDARTKSRHDQALLANIALQETIVKSFETLVKYLENKTTKTEVVNQLKEIGTPDAAKVVAAVNGMHETIRGKKETDLSEVTKILQGVLDEAKQLPKELPTIPETKLPDYTNSFDKLIKAMGKVQDEVKSQKLVAEAPIVNVPETVVNVDAPDLKPIQTGLSSVEKAIKAVKLPKTDTSKMEKQLAEANKLLAKLKETLEEMPSGGGGGGGMNSLSAYDTSEVLRSVTAVESADNPGVYGLLVLNADGTAVSTGGGGSSSSSTYGSGTYGSATYA